MENEVNSLNTRQINVLSMMYAIKTLDGNDCNSEKALKGVEINLYNGKFGNSELINFISLNTEDKNVIKELFDCYEYETLKNLIIKKECLN